MNDCRETKEGQEDDEAEETVEEATTAATDMDSLAAEESSVIREDPCIEIFQRDLTVTCHPGRPVYRNIPARPHGNMSSEKIRI